MRSSGKRVEHSMILMDVAVKKRVWVVIKELKNRTIAFKSCDLTGAKINAMPEDDVTVFPKLTAI